jgi:hypothetical protein
MGEITMVSIAKALDECLDASVLGREEVESCLGKYPQYVEELRGYIRLALTLKSVHKVKLSQRWRQKTLKALQEKFSGANGSKPASTELPTKDLKQADIFHNLTDEQLNLVIKLGRIEKRHTGETLGFEGSQGESLYVILEGRVQLTTSTPIGQLAVRMAEPNESLPLAAVIGTGSLITNVIAFSEVRALVIPRAKLLDLCSERPDIGFEIFRAISEILANRYRSALNGLSQRMDKLRELSEWWVNV